MFKLTQSAVILQIILVQYIVYVQCNHVKVDTAEMLSKTLLKKLNQTGIDAELMSIKSKTKVGGLPTNKSIVAKATVSNSTISNLSSRHLVKDFTDFRSNLNDWVILGQWARYHLTFFTGNKPVPKVPSSVDQTVMICTVTKFPSSLTKEFVGLSNSFLTIVHYVSFGNDISIEGIISSNNKTEVFFALNQDDLYETNKNWIVNTFAIPKHIQNMTIILQPRSSGDAKWAIASLTINGTEISANTSSIIVKPIKKNVKKSVTVKKTTTPAPTTIKPNITMLPQNVTTPKPLKNSTTVPLVTVTSSDVKETTKLDAAVKSIHGVATAIWDAFYVFLALFCACMIALVVLIARQR